jgi:hypothetical protein
LWIIVCYAEPVVVHRGVFRFTTTGLSIPVAHHDSQPLFTA